MSDEWAIEAQGLFKSYGRVQALNGLDLKIRTGAIGLLGPNGAGKSTLIKALLGLVRLQRGTARVLGFDCRRDARRIRQRVGFMPEDDCTVGGMVGVSYVAYCGELYGLPPRAALRRAHEILDYVGVGEERYRPIESYSLGMRQKVKLAQALVHDPKLIFLDEPTTGLDPRARTRMLDLIRDLAQVRRIGVIVSTHILPDVEQTCDEVVILGRGRLRVHDTLETLTRPADDTHVVRIMGDLAALSQALAAAGCVVSEEGADTLRVTGAGATTAQCILQAARDTNVQVRELAPARSSLEEIFVKATEEDSPARI